MDRNAVSNEYTVLAGKSIRDGGHGQLQLPGMKSGGSYSIQASCTLDGHLEEMLFNCRSEARNVFSAGMENNEKGSLLVFTFYTEGEDEPFILDAPFSKDDLQCRLEFTILVSDIRAELYVNGGLMDEEWPLGTAACTAEMLLETGRSVENIVVCCYPANGALSIPLKDEKMPLTTGLQYWKPKGHNTGVGDCMPFYYAGAFHLFYLFDRRGHKSKHNLGAHQWAHTISYDLVHWTHPAMAIPISEQMEGSICTGSAFVHQGKFFLFYSVRMSDRSAARLSVSTGEDGHKFSKHPPLSSLMAPYDGPSARDPIVFRDDSGGFHMLVTTSLEQYPVKTHSGCLAHLVSRDLWHWEQREPFLIPGYDDQPECADYFCWKGWYYLVFSNHGIARYRMSRNAFGPWSKPGNDMLNCPNVRVPKTAEYHDGRRISVGFLHNNKHYAGCTVFREIVQNPDGTLGSSFVEEMMPSKHPADYKIKPLTGEVGIHENSVCIKSLQDLSAAMITDLPVNKRITMIVEPGEGVFGFYFKSDCHLSKGMELRLEPAHKKAAFIEVGDPSGLGNSHDAIDNIAELAGPFSLDIIINDQLIDVCIGKKRTMIVRHELSDTKTVCIYTHCGAVDLKDLKVTPLD